MKDNPHRYHSYSFKTHTFEAKLTVGKINLIRADVRKAMLAPVGMFTMFRKSI